MLAWPFSQKISERNKRLYLFIYIYIHQTNIHTIIIIQNNNDEQIILWPSHGQTLGKVNFRSPPSIKCRRNKLNLLSLQDWTWCNGLIILHPNSSCYCNETPSTGRYQDYFYLHFIQKLFSKKAVMQYTPLTLNAIQFAQQTLAINACISHNIRLNEMCAYWQKNNFADSSIVRVKYIMISSCRWWRFLTATSAIAMWYRHIYIIFCFKLLQFHSINKSNFMPYNNAVTSQFLCSRVQCGSATQLQRSMNGP